MGTVVLGIACTICGGTGLGPTVPDGHGGTITPPCSRCNGSKVDPSSGGVTILAPTYFSDLADEVHATHLKVNKIWNKVKAPGEE